VLKSYADETPDKSDGGTDRREWRMQVNFYSYLIHSLTFLMLTGSDTLIAQSISVESNRPSHSTFAIGENITINFFLTGYSPNSQIPITFEIRRESGSLVAESKLIISTDGIGNGDLSYAAPSSKLGYYEIRATTADGTKLAQVGTRPVGLSSYAVVPDPAKRLDYGDSKTRFGLLGGFSAAAPVIPYLGVRYLLRGKDWVAADLTGLTNLFPIDSYDQLSYAGKAWPVYGFSTPTKARVPDWAFVQGTAGILSSKFGALNSAGEAGLSDFTAKLAEQFVAREPHRSNRMYQITWEPQYNWGFGGNPEQLVRYYELSYAAIKASDPKSLITGPTLFFNPYSTGQLGKLLQAGLGNYIDILAVHQYAKYPPETDSLTNEIRSQLDLLYAATGKHVPFIGTEAGLMSHIVGLNEQALGNVRNSLITLGEGGLIDFGFYTADFWPAADPSNLQSYGYYWNLNPRVPHGSDKLGPKPIVPAYAAMTYFIDGSISEGPVTGLSGTQRGYTFIRGSTRTMVLWDYNLSSSFLVSTKVKQICDWMGNCRASGKRFILLSPRPVYLIY
jgi:hypothetical protein